MVWSLFTKRTDPGSTVPPGSVYPDEQSLGSKIGDFDVSCNLDSKASKWTINEDGSEVRGLLYFTICFKEQRSVPLRHVIVTVDIGWPTNKEPVPIFLERAPSNGFRALFSAPEAADEKADKKSTPGVQGDAEWWSFDAGVAGSGRDTRVTVVEFWWSRSSKRIPPTLRTLKGAAILCSRNNQPLTLRVGIQIIPWHRSHFMFRFTKKEKLSLPIGPGTELTTASEFEQLQNGLEAQLVEMNRQYI